jgi:hypothetical protein
MRPTHRRANPAQALWIVFGGAADMPWQRWLAPGFRHCFAAQQDSAGWTVLDPLQGRLVVARLDVPADFDLPEFYRRAGLLPVGPLRAGPPRAGWLPGLLPLNCVGLCRALLGAQAPFAMTPFGLYRALAFRATSRTFFLTSDDVPGYSHLVNGRTAPASRPDPSPRVPAFSVSPDSRSAAPMGSLFRAPTPAATEEAARTDARSRARRGIAGTIVTGARGALAPLPATLPRRSLLGE